MFRTAKQNRIFEDVVGQIQEAILDGRLKAGDMLPPERELKDIFKTSRGTLREALRVLEQKGLIEIRLGVGGGALVREVSSDRISESLALLLQSRSVSLEHLAEFREGVEGCVAALAAERATPNDVVRLKELLVQAQNHRDGGGAQWVPFLDVDHAFHTELARITGNPIYILLQETLHANIHPYFEQYLSSVERNIDENYQDLRNIVMAIEEKDSHLARSLIKSHVRRFNQYMQDHASRPHGKDPEDTTS